MLLCQSCVPSKSNRSMEGETDRGLPGGQLEGASQLGKAVIQGLHGHGMAGVAHGAPRLLQQGCRPGQHHKGLVQVPSCTCVALQVLIKHILDSLRASACT